MRPGLPIRQGRVKQACGKDTDFTAKWILAVLTSRACQKLARPQRTANSQGTNKVEGVTDQVQATDTMAAADLKLRSGPSPEEGTQRGKNGTGPSPILARPRCLGIFYTENSKENIEYEC
jgi:hypothetical protein